MRIFYLAQFHFEKIQAGKLTFKVSDKKSRLTSQMCPKLKMKRPSVMIQRFWQLVVTF